MTFGTIKHWDASKGFGFITTDRDEDVFLHVSNLAINLKPSDLKEGLRVKFDVKSDMRGDKAINIRRA
jgi:CspA family cold shock protein